MHVSLPGRLQVGGVDGWGPGGGAGGGGEVGDDGEGLLESGVLAEDLLAVLLLLRWLIHQLGAISQSAELSQELRADELLHLRTETGS